MCPDGRPARGLAARLRAAGGTVTAEALDVADFERLAAFVTRVATGQGLDILVNNAPSVTYARSPRWMSPASAGISR